MDRKIAEEAYRWLLVLKDASPHERQDFVAWIRQSPDHLQEFLAMSAIDDKLSSCNWDEMRELDELIRSFPENVIQFPGEFSVAGKAPASNVAIAPATAPEVRSWRGAAVAAACMALGAAGLWLYQTRDVIYETAVGEQRTVQLDDGSVMSINTQSKASFSMTQEGRYVTLQGEAVFTVAHDAARPFYVRSGEVVARAIGTQFNVRSYPSGTTVSVLEGTVGVTAAAEESGRIAGQENDAMADTAAGYSVVLTAGKEAHMDRQGAVRTVELADPASVLSWQQRLLVFRGNTVEDMIAEFNRWNRRKIRLVGHIDSDRRYDGVFSASDPESLLDFLALDKHTALERTADEIVLRPRVGLE